MLNRIIQAGEVHDTDWTIVGRSKNEKRHQLSKSDPGKKPARKRSSVNEADPGPVNKRLWRNESS